jgi:hypothetical protein
MGHDPGDEQEKPRDIQEVNHGRPFLYEFLPLGKNQEIMKKERRKSQERRFIQPVENGIEEVKLSRRGKCVKRIQKDGQQIEIDIGEGEGLG